MRILLNSKDLVLKDDTLEINSANPFLENEEERIDNIFSIQIPITGNEVALNYANNIDAIVGNEFTCEIISSINFLGVAIVTEVSTEENKAILQIGYAKSNFNFLIKDKKMKELDFGTIQCAKKLKIQKSYPHVSTTIVNNTRDLFELLLAYKEGDNDYFVNNKIVFARDGIMQIKIRGGFGNIYTDSFTVCYMKNNNFIRVKTVYPGQSDYVNINAICNITGNQNDVVRIFVEVNHTSSMYMTTLFCALDFDCTIDLRDFVPEANADENTNYVFPMIQNNGMADQFPDCNAKSFYSDTFPLINNIFTNEKSIFFDYQGIPYTKIIIPCMKASYILDCIFGQCGYDLDKNSFDNIYKQLIVFTGEIIGDYKAYSDNFFIDIPKEFELNKCFENNILISDFLKDLSIVTGFFPIFNYEARSVKFVSIADLYTNVIDINCVVINDTIDYDYEKKGIIVEVETGEDDFLKENYNNLEDYNFKGNIALLNDAPTDAELNDCYYVVTERKYYAYSFGKATETATSNTLFWKFVSLDFRLKKEDGKEEFISFKSETPIMVGVTTSILGDSTAAYQNINIPVTKQAIRINQAYETYENKFSNSFLINRGLRTKDGLGEYLYASADNFFGQTQSNEISLRVDGEYGIANRMYKNLLRIYSQGKRHSISGYMKTDEIKKLTYENLIEVDNSVNLLLSYSYTLRDSEYMEVELELIKI